MKKKQRCSLCGHLPAGAPRKLARDRQIRKSRATPAEIAHLFGITTQRVYQIKGGK